MTRKELCAKIQEAIKAFKFHGKVISFESYGNGHINDTFLVKTTVNGNTTRYILQRINHDIFTNPMNLMENISGVCSFIKDKVEERGGDVSREAITLIPTLNGGYLFKDSINSYWRAYSFIDGVCLEMSKSKEDFYQSAVAFGRFQAQLSEYPASTLYETIPNFHNTPIRYSNFEKAVKEDVCKRAKLVEKEIDIIRSYKSFTFELEDAYKAGKLPLRVTHNDTKLNNVILDKVTLKPLCIIDLDTVMPGFSVNDFGDSIRFGASTALEDEQNLSKVHLNLELFECYTKGFLEECGDKLTKDETNLLPVGAKMMTLECAIRFLTDYLSGDTYFKSSREGQNLDRCRTQLKLVSEIDAYWNEINSIVDKYKKIFFFNEI